MKYTSRPINSTEKKSIFLSLKLIRFYHNETAARCDTDLRLRDFKTKITLNLLICSKTDALKVIKGVGAIQLLVMT